MADISVIIPTRNRPQSLGEALHSIANQTLERLRYEIIVIDNGTGSETREAVTRCSRQHDRHIRCVHAQEPGLHVGRHLGARQARGDILTFTDDDVIAAPEWLEAILAGFQDANVVLLGGKVLPKWEAEVPEWLSLFYTKRPGGWTNGYLSLLDFGDSPREIPARFVYGCNYSIRKRVLFECNGFHPDGMPPERIAYRGDGETALSREIEKRGYKVLYSPTATVYHRIPRERLTVDYFCQRAFNQGISDSFTEIRERGGFGPDPSGQTQKGDSVVIRLRTCLQTFFLMNSKTGRRQHPIVKKVMEAHGAGKAFHRAQVAQNPELLEYVLKESYF